MIPSLVMVLFHLSAAAFCLLTLTQGMFYQGLLRIGLESTGWHPVLAWWTVVLGVVMLLSIAVLAIKETRRTVRRLRAREPEPDLALRLRVMIYAALACIVISALFLSSPEGVTGPFRLRLPIMGWITAALGYGCFALWYRKLPWLRQTLSARVRRGADTIAINLALILVLTEVSLRVLAGFWSSPLLVTDAMPSQVRRESNRLPPAMMWHGYPMNSGGHYDTEFDVNSAIPGPLVVSIGDSFSYGTVPLPYHFTTVAEALRPSVEIYNMGFSGIGPSDYLHLLEQVALPLQPDLIVIQLFVGNDLVEGYASGGPAQWYDGDSYLVAVVWHRLRLMARSEISDEGRVIAQTPYPSQEALLAAMPHITDPFLEVQSLTESAFLDIEFRNAKRILLPAPGVYERFFEELAKIEQAAGDIPLKFVVIPEEFQVEDHVWKAVASRIGQPVERNFPQRKIVEWMKARDRPVLDLLPLLRAAEPLKDGRLHLYHLHNLHFNARGNEIAGRALAKFIGPLDTAPSRPISD